MRLLLVTSVILLLHEGPASGRVLQRHRRQAQNCSEELSVLVEQKASKGQTLSNPGGPVIRAVIGPHKRVEFIEAKVERQHVGTGTPISPEMEQLGKSMGAEGDIAGHVIAQNLGGPGHMAWNIMPQSPNMAYKESWAQTEQDVANIASRGTPVSYLVLLEYPNDEATRPDSIWYSYAYTDSSGNHCSAGSIFAPQKVKWTFRF